ncbi:MAG: OmpA family protein [Nitrospirales bacterium]|nr:OmpA family protein [Nitrospira sp.]MDR4501757.1 OmpA family protein [Nitrospirales bacterium]
MNGRNFHIRYLIAFVTLLSFVFLLSGCGHRSVRGSSHAQKSHEAKGHDAAATQRSSLDELAREHAAADLPLLDERGNTGDHDFSSNGLFSEEPVFEDSEAIKTLTPQELAKQYWQQRQQAELMSNRSGMKDVYFELDSWELTEQAKLTLASNADYLRKHQTNVVTIEGHCDERGTRAYNYVLGEKRALRVRNYLASLGVSSEQLTIMSYGKDNPVCRETSDICLGKNRRAHFLLAINVADTRSWDDDLELLD